MVTPRLAMRPLLALALLVGFAVAAPVPKAVKKGDDKTALVGTWKVTALDGRNDGKFHTHTFIFDAEGGVKTLYGVANDSGWAWTIDPAESPKRMKWVANGKGQSDFDLVYELGGETLKVGFLGNGAKPPAKVAVGPGVTLYEMTRDTSAK